MCASSSSAYTLRDQELMARARNYFAWQQRLAARELGQRIVEIGCGIGNFTGALLDRELVISVDAEPACIERLKRRYPNQPNLLTITGDWNGSNLPDLTVYRPDSCVCFNVLEHLADDRKALRKMASILPPGGIVVLLLPAFRFLYGPIDHFLGHHRRYNRASIDRLASDAGLRLKTTRDVNLIGFFGWWMNAHVFRRKAQSKVQIDVFDRYVVPVASRLESLLPPPFGQSIFAVLEKP